MSHVSPPPKSKLPWIIGGLVALGLVCCGGPMLFMGVLGLGAKKHEEEQAKKIEDAKPIEISAAQLFSEYMDNETRANDQYKGKVLQVSGQIDRIREGYVMLKGGQRIPYNVACEFGDEDRKAVASLSSGSEVTVRGICDGKGVRGVKLLKCKLVK